MLYEVITGVEIWSKTDSPTAQDVCVDNEGYVYATYYASLPHATLKKIDGNSYYKILS